MQQVGKRTVVVSVSWLEFWNFSPSWHLSATEKFSDIPVSSLNTHHTPNRFDLNSWQVYATHFAPQMRLERLALIHAAYNTSECQGGAPWPHESTFSQYHFTSSHYWIVYTHQVSLTYEDGPRAMLTIFYSVKKLLADSNNVSAPCSCCYLL